MKILVADDDAISRRLMERTLLHSGYEVITVADGRQAVEELSKPDGPRLALIDWMMPEIDGLGVCRAIRDRHDDRYTYMLLLTSKESSEDVVQGLEAGADDYLTKPCHPAELKARLHTGRRILQLEDKLVEAREEMRYKATHDSLTTLWDRGAILALLRSELHRSMRDKKEVSVLLCDVDHFKKVNDTYGHPVGDEVLIEVATRLQTVVRPHDAVGRYGGEEFMIVLGVTSGVDLRDRAEQLRKMIAATPIQTQQGPVSVTMSVGVVTIAKWDKSMAIEPFVQEADDALYRAKAMGRNRVVFADSPVAA